MERHRMIERSKGRGDDVKEERTEKWREREREIIERDVNGRRREIQERIDGEEGK